MANMRAELSSSSSALIAAQAEAARADGKAAAEKAALKEAEARHAARVKVGTPGKAVADKTALTEAQARHGARVKVIAAQGVGLLICITGVCFRTHSKAAAELVLKKAEAGMLRRARVVKLLLGAGGEAAAKKAALKGAEARRSILVDV
eukprot:1160939-Pelagomonas_calceolata.AAC.7